MVNRARVRPLNQARPGQGPVVYWMSRDQRVRDNWALLYAQELALAWGNPWGWCFAWPRRFWGHPAPVRLYAPGVAGGGRGPGRSEPAVFPA